MTDGAFDLTTEAKVEFLKFLKQEYEYQSKLKKTITNDINIIILLSEYHYLVKLIKNDLEGHGKKSGSDIIEHKTIEENNFQNRYDATQ